MRYAVTAHQGQYALEEDGRRVAVVYTFGAAGWKWRTRKGEGSATRLHRGLLQAYRLLRSGAPDLPVLAHDMPLHPPRTVPCAWTGISYSTKLGKEDGV